MSINWTLACLFRRARTVSGKVRCVWQCSSLCNASGWSSIFVLTVAGRGPQVLLGRGRSERRLPIPAGRHGHQASGRAARICPPGEAERPFCCPTSDAASAAVVCSLQRNPKRFSQRRHPAEISSLQQPFDPDSFNFNKIHHREVQYRARVAVSIRAWC